MQKRLIPTSNDLVSDLNIVDISAKLQIMRSIILICYDLGKRMFFTSNSKVLCQQIQKLCQSLNIQCVHVSGNTLKRQALVESFKTGVQTIFTGTKQTCYSSFTIRV